MTRHEPRTLDEAIDHLAESLGVGETIEIVQLKATVRRSGAQARRDINCGGFYTRHTLADARRAAAQTAQRYR